MPRPKKVDSAKPFIMGYFQTSQQKIFTYSDLNDVLLNMRDEWNLAQSMGLRQFVTFLVKETEFSEERLKFPSRTLSRYCWGPFNSFELAMSLRPNGYLSHQTAAYLNDLTTELPEDVYVNEEQYLRSSESNLQQAKIDFAFSRSPRVSNNRIRLGSHTYCILNGMNTGEAGVENRLITGTGIRVTNIERTLIDMVVRPIYSGGPTKVLEAYQLAAGRMSTRIMADILRSIGYVYPYHQAIGFYLDKSGKYSEAEIKIFKDIERPFKFYLAHKMNDIDYSPDWNIYYPKYL